MAETVRLTVLTGLHKGRRFCFRGPTECTVGRAPDCFVRFGGAERDQCISRHHCQLHLDPPCVRVQDLGSLNGTYVNGRAIERETAKDEAASFQGDSGIAVADGDIITIGGSSFRVDIVACPPDLPEAAEHGPIWQADEVAKKDCSIRC
jgi:pSer/pThr/pTyr-binding forkhead associated (FHA) protein